MGIYNTKSLLVTLALSALAIAAIACETDEQKIRDANEAAASGVRTSGNGLTENISIFDLRTGDCYNEPNLGLLGDNEEIEILEVELVPCTSAYEFKVLNTVLLDHPEGARYPGVSYFDTMFFEECPQTAEYVLYPTSESWEFGDRVFTCIAEG